MPRIRIKQDDQKQRRSISEAQKNFIMQCKLKNLAPYTIKYYEENLIFFQSVNRKRFIQTRVRRFLES